MYIFQVLFSILAGEYNVNIIIADIELPVINDDTETATLYSATTSTAENISGMFSKLNNISN